MNLRRGETTVVVLVLLDDALWLSVRYHRWKNTSDDVIAGKDRMTWFII
jgi:hypothetical protein